MSNKVFFGGGGGQKWLGFGGPLVAESQLEVVIGSASDQISYGYFSFMRQA